MFREVSEPQGFSCFLGFQTSREENRLAEPERARNLARIFARKTCLGAAKSYAKFGAKSVGL